LGSQQLSIHIKTLLDDLKFFKDYCPRNLFSGSNFSPEISLQKNLSIFCLENQSCDLRRLKLKREEKHSRGKKVREYGSGVLEKNPRMAARLDAAALDGMSKKELVVAVQSVAPLELLQANTVTFDLL